MAHEYKKSVLLPVLSVIMFFVFVIMIFFTVLCVKKPKEEVTKTFPVMKISLLNTTLAEVHENGKNIKYDGNNLEIFDNGITNFYDNVEFKGRGNFSWDIDKKSYRIKFDKKVDLFGMGKKRKWALIGNGEDDSLLRNDLAYYISDIMGGEYEAEGRFVELYVNDEDLGVYYLVKTMEIGSRMVDLREPEGVLVEMDKVYYESEGEWWEAKNGDIFTVKDIVTKDLTDDVMKEFIKEYNALLLALKKRDFEQVSEIVDVESFAKYYLISEFAANPDAYMTSWFLYKDGFDDKIHAGIIWDFALAFGNRVSESFQEVDAKNLSQVMLEFLEMPEFRKMVSEMYTKELRGKKDLILGHLAETSAEIREAALRNAEKWGGDFDAEFIYLANWVSARFEMFEKGIGSSLFTAGAAPAANVGNAPTKAD